MSVCEIHPEATTVIPSCKNIYDSTGGTSGRLLKRDINISPRSRTSPLIYVTRPLRIVVGRPKMDESRARVIQSGRGNETKRWPKGDGATYTTQIRLPENQRARSIARD